MTIENHDLGDEAHETPGWLFVAIVIVGSIIVAVGLAVDIFW